MRRQKYFKIPRLSLKNNNFFNFLDFFQKPLAKFSGMVYTYFYSDNTNLLLKTNAKNLRKNHIKKFKLFKFLLDFLHVF